MEKSIILVGAGAMGVSLAQVYAQAGYAVTLYNRSESGIERAKALLAMSQETMKAEDFVTEEDSKALIARIAYTTDKACFASASLVVEAIAEVLEEKRVLWAEISQLVPPTALLATNTSGLPISEIATAVKNPERFMGQHWLNPPHLLPLCEIIAGDETDPVLLQTMYDLVKALGKKPVMVKKDVKGFVLNRLQYALLREALYIVENDIATLEDVDMVFTAGLGLRYAAVGPFRVCDFNGVETYARVSKYLFKDLSSEQEGNAYLADLYEKERHGVKVGAGFYDYPGEVATEAIKKKDALYMALAKVLYKEN